MIYLHVGVHKTATTYLQNLLGINQGRIAECGRAYWRLFETRRTLEELVAPHFWTEQGVEHLKNDRSSPLYRIREFVAVAPDCVISDENILGWATDPIGGQFYPHAGKRLPRIRKALADKTIELWLCLRAYDEFLASVYGETLRTGHFTPAEEFVANYSPLPDARWPTLLDAIHASFPASRVVVWAYEDFSALLPQIATRLSGLPYDDLTPFTGDPNPSLSGEAIRQHCLVAPSKKTRAERIQSLALCAYRYPRERFPESFYPWSPDAATAMQAAYRQDLADIGARPYVELLTPG